MAEEKCPHCGATVGPYDQKCAACGKGLSGRALLGTSPVSAASETIARVSVVDINMPFGSMVSFMVKWAIAAIPAIIILAVLFSVVTGILAGVMRR
jgi:hypothetical protein